MKIVIVLASLLVVLYPYKGNYPSGYTLIKKVNSVEIRQYEPSIFASYTELNGSNNSQFRALAGYIFGSNEKEEKIGMTSPVSMVQSSKKEMLFLMPSSYSLESLPKPKNKNIKIIEVGERKVAALRFSGYANQNSIQKQKKILINTLDTHQIYHSDHFEVLVYNSPYKLFNRRNEIIVVL